MDNNDLIKSIATKIGLFNKLHSEELPTLILQRLDFYIEQSKIVNILKKEIDRIKERLDTDDF